MNDYCLTASSLFYLWQAILSSHNEKNPASVEKKHSTFNYGQRLRLDISFPVFAPEYQRVEEKGGALIDLVNYRNMLSVDMNAALILYIIVLYIIATGHLELVFATDSCIQAPCRPFYQPSLR